MITENIELAVNSAYFIEIQFFGTDSKLIDFSGRSAVFRTGDYVLANIPLESGVEFSDVNSIITLSNDGTFKMTLSSLFVNKVLGNITSNNDDFTVHFGEGNFSESSPFYVNEQLVWKGKIKEV